MREHINENKQKQVYKVIGKHVYGNLYEIEDKFLTDLEFLIDIVNKSAEIGNLHIIEVYTKKFKAINNMPGGVSVIALLEESHIALHTWPESNYATIDIYSCGKKSSPEESFKFILNKLKPKTFKMFKADRGN